MDKVRADNFLAPIFASILLSKELLFFMLLILV